MSRRVRIDPETARLVEERLQWLLQEHGPEPVPLSEPGPRTDQGSSGRPGPLGAVAAASAVAPARSRGRRAAPQDDDQRRPDAGRSERAAVDDQALLVAEAALLDELDREAPSVRSVPTARPAPPTAPAPALSPPTPMPRRQHDGDPEESRPARRSGGRPLRSEDSGSLPDRPAPGHEGGSRLGSVAVLASAAVGFRRPHLVIVGVIVALGILLSGWAVLRARPVAVAVTPPPAASADPSTGAEPGAAGSTPSSHGNRESASPGAPSVVVHVLGAVKKPGLVSLTAGSRVQDAIDAAGGLTRKADPGELNLAQQVADGQQIVVGTTGRPSGEVRKGAGPGGSTSSSGSGTGGSAGGAGQPVNLNTATQAELEELPGVGPVMAGKIIAWRTEHGRFSRVEELQEIDGVGPKTYAKLAPLCQV